MPETASLTTEIVNPVIQSTLETFDLMMDVRCWKKGLALLTPETPYYAVSAVISLTGRVAGSLCLSFDRTTAFGAVKAMLDMDIDEVNGLVCDTVGEFANVIAGNAKDKVTELDLEIGIPNIIRGENHRIEFPSSCQPFCADFDSDIGPFRIMFGFVAR